MEPQPGCTYSDKERAAIIAHHCEVMNSLARLSGSGITIFDHRNDRHIFTSDNFPELFGYDLGEIAERDCEYFNERIHPDDFSFLNEYGNRAIELMRARQEFEGFKYIIEYRIVGREGKYVRVIEQHSILENEADGLPWLMLSFLDISPDQSPLDGVRYQIVNFKSGEYYSLAELAGEKSPVVLSKREREILSLIKAGMSSKSISEKLFISIHTVNTHRQRILEKLDAGNSLEAIRHAEKMGSL